MEYEDEIIGTEDIVESLVDIDEDINDEEEEEVLGNILEDD